MGPTAEQRLRAAIEHTLLAADATADQVRRLCDEALRQRFAGVCVNPTHVPRCRALLGGSPVRLVTVVGFPLGANRSQTKAYECALAVGEGADEIDMVLDLGAARAGDWERVKRDVSAVVEAATGQPVKVILETARLDDDQKRAACAAAVLAGASFVKTSTGFGGGGATTHDVALMRQAVGPGVGIKASGGIRTRAQALALLDAGADRLGTSAGLALIA
ncbi:MAG: deoxyribose-phosphate aldolase [Myxococcales bacterium]|jgi:deoxyribose-phosphate aldolase